MKKTGKNILVVDDDPDFLDMAQEALQSEGYHVITKTNGHTALTAIDGGAAVDVVITDCKMSPMSGLKFVSALRRRGLPAPIIMLSAYGTVETYLKAMHLGVYEFVNKPVKLKELKAIVESALRCPIPHGYGPFTEMTKPKRHRFKHL